MLRLINLDKILLKINGSANWIRTNTKDSKDLCAAITL